MMDPAILAVVINWRRPHNIPHVFDALRAQTIPVHICLVECSPELPEFAISPGLRARADTVFTVNRNFGPSSRFIPALAFTEFDYVFFQVDDFAPGPRCVEHFLSAARLLNGQFATLGQDGRRANEAGPSLNGRRIKQHAGECVPVDVVTSSELVRADLVHHAVDFRWQMIRRHGVNPNEGVSLFEDDLILCLGIQKATGLPSLLTPACATWDESWRYKRLDDAHALCARPDHRPRRDRFMEQAWACGWRFIR